ncbi:hypothetical protein ACF0H5_012844 [Mactra antiquata]
MHNTRFIQTRVRSILEPKLCFDQGVPCSRKTLRVTESPETETETAQEFNILQTQHSPRKRKKIGDEHVSETYDTKYELQIVCFVFDRAQSLMRLLRSLNDAYYYNDKVTLTVWLDRDVNDTFDQHTFETVTNFTFLHGNYIINIHNHHVGLRGQWLNSYNPVNWKENEIVVFFEDDVSVSRYFYRYLKLVHSKYANRTEINGYSLQGGRKKLKKGLRGMIEVPYDQPVFKNAFLAPWGFSPKMENWKKFLEWYDKAHRNESFHPLIPDHQSSVLYKIHRKRNTTDQMWTLWHMYYSLQNKEFTLICNYPDHRGFATHWSEDGVHFQNRKGSQMTPLFMEWHINQALLPDDPIEIDYAGKRIKK